MTTGMRSAAGFAVVFLLFGGVVLIASRGNDQVTPIPAPATPDRVPASPGLPLATPHPEETPALRILVRDMMDGSPRRNAEVSCLVQGESRAGEPRKGLTDSEGAIRLPRPGLARAWVEEGPWRGSLRPEEIREGATLWVYRTLRVRCTVEPESSPTASANGGEQWALRVVLVGSPASTLATPTTDPWTPQWALLHDIPRDLAERPSADGSYRLSVPAIRWIGIDVRGSTRYVTETYEVPLPPIGVDDVEMQVRPRASKRIEGRVVSKSGPLPSGSILYAHVLETAKAASFNWERFEAEDGPARTARQEGDDVWIQFADRVVLPPGGAFTVLLPRIGAVVLVVHAPGHAPERLELHLTDESAKDVVLELEPRPAAAQLTFERKGTGLAHWKLAVTDVTERRVQTLCELQLGSSGEVSGEWFEPGRSYWLLLTPTHASLRAPSDPSSISRFVLWTEGMTRVDVDSLSKRLEDVPRK